MEAGYLMLTITVSPADIAALRQIPGALDQSMRRAALSIATRSANTLRDTAPKATSQMTNSIRPYSTSAGADVIVATNYAAAVHDGRGAGRVNGHAIADWAQSIGLSKQAGFAIAHSISIKGTKKQPWVKDYVESAAFGQLARTEVNRAVA